MGKNECPTLSRFVKCKNLCGAWESGWSILADGYKMIRLIIEYTDADSVEPDEIL